MIARALAAPALRREAARRQWKADEAARGAALVQRQIELNGDRAPWLAEPWLRERSEQAIGSAAAALDAARDRSHALLSALAAALDRLRHLLRAPAAPCPAADLGSPIASRDPVASKHAARAPSVA